VSGTSARLTSTPALRAPHRRHARPRPDARREHR
jgi:hypothetical protein